MPHSKKRPEHPQVKAIRAALLARMRKENLNPNQVSIVLEGVSRPVLYEFLNGDRDIALSSLLYIADALEMKVRLS